jgi:hypothetical protein
VTENKFQPIPFSTFGDTNLHIIIQPKYDADADTSTESWERITDIPILGMLELKIVLLALLKA